VVKEIVAAMPEPLAPTLLEIPVIEPIPTAQAIANQSAQRPEPSYFNLPYQPPVPRAQKPPVRETISEASLFQRDGSLNDALGKQKPVHNIASSITDIPVADIWSAITINQRFLFIRELFKNEPDGFKNTVTLLNTLESWDAAKRHLADSFDWDPDNHVVADFLNVVRRRFLK
jgi:hypothetical protein